MQDAIVTLVPLEVKPLAVLVAGLSGFVVGGIWYGPLFAKPWMSANGFTEEDLRRDFSPVRAYGTALVCSLIAAYALAAVLGSETTPINGAFVGMLVGLVWVATSFATSYAFERRSTTLLMINAGYHVIEFAVMGAIIGAMQ